MNILIIGGSRFFGKHLAADLLAHGHEVTLLNRGTLMDGLQGVRRLQADRNDALAMQQVLRGQYWDRVYDQVCYDGAEAKAAVNLFKDKTKRYIFTSTQSVYGQGGGLRETEFSAHSVTTAGTNRNEDYGQAKREAESVFANEWPHELVCVRMGMVVGEDDYTGRLQWHMDHVAQNKPMFFPDPSAHLGYIHARQAALALRLIGESTYTGPVNCAAPGAYQLRDLMNLIKEVVGGEVVFSNEGEPSPYGIASDWWMDTSRLTSLGVNLDPVQNWMEKLVRHLHLASRDS